MASVTERFNLQSAQSFATGFRPPFSPTICPVCFAYFAKKIEPNNSVTRLLQTKCHAFWDALMAFIAADWTPQRQTSVSAMLERTNSRCTRCKPAGAVGYLTHQVPDTDSWFGLVFQIACSCVHAGSISRLVRNVGKRGRWPNTAEHLFPYGPERTIAALVARLSTYSFVEGVIINLVSLQRATVFPLLSETVNRSRVIEVVIQRLKTCMSAVNAEFAQMRQPVAQSVQRTVARRHLQPCEGSVHMLHIIAFGPDNKPSDKTEFFCCAAPELFEALHPIVMLVYEDDEYSWMPILASHLWVALSSAQRAALGCPDPPVYGREIDSSEGLKDPYHALRFFLSHRPTHRHCNGPACGKALDSGFSRCGKCRVMLYCSRECQRADWTRAGPFPHREICDMLQELYTFATLDASMRVEAFADACRAHSFPLERVDRLIAWATNGETCTNYAGGVQLVMAPGPSRPEFRPVMTPLQEDSSSKPGNKFLIQVPATPDGRLISQSELHATMLRLKESMKHEGLDISWTEV